MRGSFSTMARVTRVLRPAIALGVALTLLACEPTPPTPRTELLRGKRTLDGRLGSTCQPSYVINGVQDENIWEPVCRLPYVRLVANADDYHGMVIGVSGYVLRTSDGLELVPSPEYLRRGLFGESISLRGGVPNDQTLASLFARPRNDLCGPVTVSGKFDRNASHDFNLGEIMMSGYVGGPTERIEQLTIDAYTCESVAAPAPAESQQRPKS
jgi:hypothetical protein